MTNSEYILKKIDSFYSPRNSKVRIPYSLLCANHLTIIELLNDFWIDIKLSKPVDKEFVICIQDLTPIGKGKFVCDYYYEDNNFVANLGDSDSYGYITHWISFENINKSTIDFNEKLKNLTLPI
ncbi:hypothetical protein GW796_07565 [archaeon]|nr:hypothetical protein [archaeon]